MAMSSSSEEEEEEEEEEEAAAAVGSAPRRRGIFSYRGTTTATAPTPPTSFLPWPADEEMRDARRASARAEGFMVIVVERGA